MKLTPTSGNALSPFLQYSRRGARAGKLLLSILVSIVLLGHFSCHKSACPKESQFIDVTDYGVIPNDDQDDTDAIRNVFLSIRDTSKRATIFFPSGTYLIDPSRDRSMEIIDNCTVVDGVKGHTILKLMDESVDSSLLCPANYLRPASDCRTKIVDNCGNSAARRLEGLLLGNQARKYPRIDNHDITIRNIIFDSNCRNNPLQDFPCYQGLQGALSLWGVNRVTVEHCEVINACQAGIQLVDCEDGLLRHNYLFDVGQGLKNADGIQVNGSTNTRIRNNLLENTGEGIFCQHWNSVDIRDSTCSIESNVIRLVDYNEKCLGDRYPFDCCSGYGRGDSTDIYCRRGRARGSSIGLLSQNSQASDNLVERHFPVTVHAQQRHADVETKNIQVFDNTLHEIAKYDSNSGGAIWLVADSNALLSEVRVYCNKIVNSYGSGIALAYTDTLGYRGQVRDLTIVSNTILGTCLDTIACCATLRKRPCAGILFQNKSHRFPQVRFRNVTVRNNTIDRVGRYTLWVDRGARELHFLGNSFGRQRPALINVQCPVGNPDCTGKTINSFRLNSPLHAFELDRIARLMPATGQLYNYCLNCATGSCAGTGTGAYATLQNGNLDCQ